MLAHARTCKVLKARLNSAGIFRKGYSNKIETVVKTEPQQPNNAVSTGSSLSADDRSGISATEPNGEPTVSDSKDTTNSQTANELEEIMFILPLASRYRQQRHM